MVPSEQRIIESSQATRTTILQSGRTEGFSSSLSEEAPGWSKTVFIVGSPRSGTTWFQLLIAQHPGVATSHETQLFNAYLAPLEDRWKYEKESAATGIRRTGLSRVLSQQDFNSLCKSFAEQIFRIIRSNNPTAEVILEKSPDHALYADLIIKLFPDAYFLHVIRDPRSVANSYRHAASTWWKGPPTGAIRSTQIWRHRVEAGRRIRLMTPRYREVRYEALLEDGPVQLEGVYRWLGLPADRNFCQRAIAACAIENLKGASSDVVCPWPLHEERPGFFRKGEADSWRREMSQRDIRIVEYLAADLMQELGYALSIKRLYGRPLRLHIFWLIEALRKAMMRLARGVRRLLHKLLWRL